MMNGIIKYKPNVANQFTMLKHGEFFGGSGALEEGATEYEPNEANGFKKCINGKWNELEKLEKGQIIFLRIG